MATWLSLDIANDFIIVIFPNGVRFLYNQHLYSLSISSILFLKLLSMCARSESKSMPNNRNLFVQMRLRLSHSFVSENRFLPIQPPYL